MRSTSEYAIARGLQSFLPSGTRPFARNKHRPRWFNPSLNKARVYSMESEGQLPLEQCCDPHSYTTGRWLRRDKIERDARHIAFDFDALARKAVQLCPGARSIVNCDKKEGGFNRVFIFTMDNAKRIVAKLPYSLAGPPRLTTNSEVATIRFLQEKTTIPIPRILDWSDDKHTAIGSEYIIMEHAAGVSLHQRWPTIPGDQKIRCIDAIYRQLKEAVDIDFPAYGSLYSVDSPIASPSRVSLPGTTCIGPHCGARYWDCDVGEPRCYDIVKPNRGPWSSLTAFVDGLVDTGISRVPPTSFPAEKKPPYHGSPQAHIDLLELGRNVLRKMAEDPRIQNASTPVLLHPDLHKRNIFVAEDDPTVVTGIIDWQSASIEPAFWYVDEVPDFTASATPHSPEDPPDVQGELCTKAFNACVQFYLPKLFDARMTDEALLRPFQYSYRTWKDGAVAFRHDLIETSQHWTDLGFAGACPFPKPSPGEMDSHQREYRFFQAAHDLRYGLASLLNSAADGWVPTEAWEETKAAHGQFFKAMLQDILSNENPDDDEIVRDEATLRSIWPFDL